MRPVCFTYLASQAGVETVHFLSMKSTTSSKRVWRWYFSCISHTVFHHFFHTGAIFISDRKPVSSVTLQQTHPQPYLSAGLSVVAQLTPTYEYFKHIIRNRNRPSCHGVITVRTGRAAAHSEQWRRGSPLVRCEEDEHVRDDVKMTDGGKKETRISIKELTAHIKAPASFMCSSLWANSKASLWYLSTYKGMTLMSLQAGSKRHVQAGLSVHLLRRSNRKH